MKTASEWFREYGVSHQDPTNKLIHWVCVPLIFLSVVGLLASIPHEALDHYVGARWQPYIHFGTLLIILGSAFYLTMSVSIFIGMLLVSILVLMINAWIESAIGIPLWGISLLIFVFAWIGQFIGHKIEGEKPSFFKDLLFLLVGPAWLLGFIYRKLGIPYS
jgi:uncharacterized membrane protein YGL010W